MKFTTGDKVILARLDPEHGSIGIHPDHFGKKFYINWIYSHRKYSTNGEQEYTLASTKKGRALFRVTERMLIRPMPAKKRGERTYRVSFDSIVVDIPSVPIARAKLVSNLLGRVVDNPTKAKVNRGGKHIIRGTLGKAKFTILDRSPQCLK